MLLSERPDGVAGSSSNGKYRMSQFYPRLLSSFKLGGVTLRNRVAVTSHFTASCVDGWPTDRTIAYYRERALGGAGLILVEANWVDQTGGAHFAGNAMACYRDEIVPHYRRLSDAVHEHGAAILCQLNHEGTYGLAGPTSMPLFMKEQPCGVAHELDHEQIGCLVDSFVSAARRLQEGGFDGAEISAAHGLLVHAFLTPLLNQRDDEYGGSLTNRMRFLVQILQGTRDVVGRDFVLGVRLSASDFADGGLDDDDVIEIAGQLEDSGWIDYLNISGGVSHLLSSIINHAGHMDDPHAQLAPLSGRIKAVVGLPILHASRIRTSDQAEQVLVAGHADIVGMTRAHISDPHLVRKTIENRTDEIMICVGCEEGCTQRIVSGEHISCIHNPVTGREDQWGKLAPAVQRRRTVVVGGGPAGLEAARVAAQRGHEVILLEKAEQLGGKVLTIAKAPLMGEFAGVVSNLVNRLGNVDVRTGVNADEATIMTLKPDVVILALGARSFELSVPNDGSITVASDEQILNDAVKSGRRTVIIDGEGRYRALNTGIHLAQCGCEVIFVTEYPMMGARFTVEKFRVRPYQKLLGLGVGLGDYLGEKVVALNGHAVTIENIYTYARRKIDNVDTVVTAFHGLSNQSLYNALKHKVPACHLIGDAYAPRDIEQACYEGHKVAREI
jgi:2,4-dienoyl-CoA reductase-like NADH-dependent reductase (Old Yellow Enzyme family)/thioredoxin reductase